MTKLPAHSTEASQKRLVVAVSLAALAPATFGNEIALTGSASLGIADDASDIELNFWCDDVPTVDERFAWIRSIGATDIVPHEMAMGDGSYWMTFGFGGVKIEAGWQRSTDVEHILRRLATGEFIDSRERAFASLVVNAVSARTSGLLARWQRQLSTYPDSLQHAVIDGNTRVWQMPHAVRGRWSLCNRGDSLSLTERLLWDVYNVLRIVFALNRQWEPDWKWLSHKLEGLEIAPDHLADRIDEVFGTEYGPHRVAVCQQLILDTLALVPPTEGTRRAQQVVEDSLRERTA